MEAEELITIAAFDEPCVAHLARGRLEAHGIECYLKNEYIVGTNWSYSNLVGGVGLQVEKADVARASKLLDEKAADDSEETDGSLCCPSCLSCDIREMPKTKNQWFWYFILVPLLTILTMALVWIVVGLWIIQKKNWKRSQCGYEWKQRKRAFPA